MHASILSLVVGALLLTPVLPAIGAEQVEQKQPLLYFELQPSIVSNLQKGANYIRADIQLVTRGPESLKELEHHAPALRHELFLLLSDQNGSTLKQPKGKEKFRKNALKSLRKVMLGLTGNEQVDDIYFTSFFVQ